MQRRAFVLYLSGREELTAVHRCATTPFPPGSVCQLENELRAGIGVQRAPADTHR
jgi:hypothetical protein